MQISITRALSLIKSKQQQLATEIASKPSVVNALIGDQKATLYPGVNSTMLASELQANKDRVTSLADSVLTLKKKVNESNNRTFVTIGGRSMTVADAIIEKSLIANKEALLSLYRSGYKNAADAVVKREIKNEEKIEALVSGLVTALASATTEAKEAIQTSIENIRNNERKNSKTEIFDPCNIKGEIEKLEKEIQDIKHELDYVLSTSNTQTQIDFE